jgi:protocatechuate 3,4-dioxygenase beta subunit
VECASQRAAGDALRWCDRARTSGGPWATLALTLLSVAISGCHRRPPAPPPTPAPPTPNANLGGETLRGQVLDEAGRAVPGARVLAFALPSPNQVATLPPEAITDASGGFAFERIPAGRYDVLIEAPGFAAGRSAAPAAVPGPALTVRLAGQGRTLSGQVLLAGAPAPGARVRLAGAGVERARETVAASDGVFSFHGLGAGRNALRASRGTLVSATLDSVAVDAPTPGHGGRAAPAARLELAPGVVIGGRVVDDQGGALASAEVRATTAVDDPLPDIARAGPDGRFTLGPLPAGDATLLPALPGYVARRASTLRLIAATPPPRQTLELVRGAALAGRIVDQAGAPVANARVRSASADATDLAVIREPLPLAAEAAALGAAAGHALGTTRTVRSDADGRFEIADLFPGRAHLEVLAPPAVPLRTPDWPLGPGQRRDVGALTLQDGIGLRGRVVDPSGVGLPGAHVTVTPAADVFAVTDAGGGFTLTLPAGAYTLQVTASGYTATATPVELARGRAAPTPEIRLARADAALDGLAQDSAGRPLAGARVLVWARPAGTDAAAAGPPSADAPQMGGAETNAGGHFRVARLPARPLLVEIRHPDYPVTFAAASPGTLARITVAIPGAVAGEVREHASGAAVPGFSIAATGPSGQRVSATRPGRGHAGSGEFLLPRLGPGHWRLTTTAPGFRGDEREIDVPASTTPGEATVRGLRIELDRTR